jgi:dihydrodipicolinate reductase
MLEWILFSKGGSRLKVVIVDGQGGRMGQMLIERIKAANLSCHILAIGTNAAAATAMLKAGADACAAGENPVIVAARTANVIIGPLGIIAADSLLGEVTPAMAVAIGASPAKKLLIPVNLCDNIVVGTAGMPLGKLIEQAVSELKKLSRQEGAPSVQDSHTEGGQL